MPLSSDWTAGKKGKDKEDIEYVLKNNQRPFKTLSEIVTRYEEEEARAEITTSQYDNPSWAYKQADRNGAMRVLKKIRSLITV